MTRSLNKLRNHRLVIDGSLWLVCWQTWILGVLRLIDSALSDGIARLPRGHVSTRLTKTPARCQDMLIIPIALILDGPSTKPTAVSSLSPYSTPA